MDWLIYINIYMHIYIMVCKKNMFIHIYDIYIHSSVYLYFFLSIICIYIYMQNNMYIYISVYMYVYIYIYEYIYVYVSIYWSTRKIGNVEYIVFRYRHPMQFWAVPILEKRQWKEKNMLIWAISKWYPILMGKYLYVICICIFDMFLWWPGPSTCQTNPGNIKRPSQYKPLSRQCHLVFGCFLIVVAWYGFEH